MTQHVTADAQKIQAGKLSFDPFNFNSRPFVSPNSLSPLLQSHSKRIAHKQVRNSYTPRQALEATPLLMLIHL
jgi:hypothetical protein